MAGWNLATKEEVSSLSGHSVTSFEDFWSVSVEALIRNYLRAPNLGEEIAVSNEYHDGKGNNILVVRQPPIVSLTSLLVNTVEALSAEYVLFNNYIQLKSRIFPVGSANVIVSYVSGGVTTIDPSIKICAASMIVAIINYRNRYGADATIKWGAALEQHGPEATPNLNVGLTSHFYVIMRRTLHKTKLRFA